jgi:hypothetical protein
MQPTGLHRIGEPDHKGVFSAIVDGKAVTVNPEAGLGGTAEARAESRRRSAKLAARDARLATGKL